MHITCWRPSPPVKDEQDPFDECKEALWLVYSWTDRVGHQWLPRTNPSHPQNMHPTLGRYVRSIYNGAIRGGNPSHFALGDTSETFFIRLSDDARNWHYRWHGLPEDCDLALQGSLVASKLDKDDKDRDVKDKGKQVDKEKDTKERCTRNLHHWTLGRPRAVTLGKDGGWILYREEQPEATWGGRNLPKSLRDALAYGRRRKLVINVSATTFSSS